MLRTGSEFVIWNFQSPAALFRRMDTNKPGSAGVSPAWHSVLGQVKDKST
jgi:hypothetical protein